MVPAACAHESSIAVRALDIRLVAHFHVDQRMAKRAAAAIARDLVSIDFDDFGRRGHGRIGRRDRGTSKDGSGLARLGFHLT